MGAHLVNSGNNAEGVITFKQTNQRSWIRRVWHASFQLRIHNDLPEFVYFALMKDVDELIRQIKTIPCENCAVMQWRNENTYRVVPVYANLLLRFNYTTFSR